MVASRLRRPRAWARAPASVCSMPNGTAWPVVALGASARRRHRRAAQHAVAAAGARGPAPHRGRRAPRGGRATFLGRDYVADLVRDLARASSPGPRLFVDALPRLRSIAVWEADRRVPTDDARRPGGGRRARRGGPARRRPRDRLHLGQPGPPKGVIHTHGGALAATEAGLDGAASRRATTASTSRCRSSGWAASAPACSRRWSPGPRCSPKRCPNRRARCRSSNGSGSRCSAGWPDQAAALARDPRLRRRRSRLAAPGQPRRRPARPSAACRRRRAANLLGMTESFGPVLRRPPRPAAPAGQGGQLRSAPSTASRSASSTSTPARPSVPTRPGEIQLRGPNLMRGICGRTARRRLHRRRFYPTGDLGRLDADGYLYLTGRRDDMFKVRGATVYPSEVERALHSIRGVRRAYVVDVVHDGGAAVAAAVIVPPDGATLDVDELDARSPGPAQLRSRCRRAGASSPTTTCPWRPPARSTRRACSSCSAE